MKTNMRIWFCVAIAALFLMHAQAAVAQWATNGNNINNTNSGNVGVGTTNPSDLLHVVKASSTNFPGIIVSDSNVVATGVGGGIAFRGKYNSAGDETTAGSIKSVKSNSVSGNFDFGLAFFTRLNGSGSVSETMRITPDGNVGIGTSNPTSPLFVAGNGSSPDYGTLRVKPTVTHGGIIIDSANDSSQVHLRFYKNGVPKWQFRVPFQNGIEDLRIYSWAVNADVLTITPAGDVSIAGTVNAKYQDVAEWVPSSERLAAGTVVVLDQTKSNQVVASTSAYDTRVAGVISAQPGITLGEKSDEKVLVATTGRVRVKVEASRGPIAIGDLLVTGDVPGVAMKSEPVEFAGRKMHMPGTILGKALEPLAKGMGEILVLLSLQ